MSMHQSSSSIESAGHSTINTRGNHLSGASHPIANDPNTRIPVSRPPYYIGDDKPSTFRLQSGLDGQHIKSDVDRPTDPKIYVSKSDLAKGWDFKDNDPASKSQSRIMEPSSLPLNLPQPVRDSSKLGKILDFPAGNGNLLPKSCSELDLRLSGLDPHLQNRSRANGFRPVVGDGHQASAEIDTVLDAKYYTAADDHLISNGPQRQHLDPSKSLAKFDVTPAKSPKVSDEVSRPVPFYDAPLGKSDSTLQADALRTLTSHMQQAISLASNRVANADTSGSTAMKPSNDYGQGPSGRSAAARKGHPISNPEHSDHVISSTSRLAATDTDTDKDLFGSSSVILPTKHDGQHRTADDLNASVNVSSGTKLIDELTEDFKSLDCFSGPVPNIHDRIRASTVARDKPTGPISQPTLAVTPAQVSKPGSLTPSNKYDGQRESTTLLPGHEREVDAQDEVDRDLDNLQPGTWCYRAVSYDEWTPFPEVTNRHIRTCKALCDKNATLNNLAVEFDGHMWALYFGDTASIYCADSTVKPQYLYVKLAFNKNIDLPPWQYSLQKGQWLSFSPQDNVRIADRYHHFVEDGQFFRPQSFVFNSQVLYTDFKSMQLYSRDRSLRVPIRVNPLFFKVHTRIVDLPSSNHNVVTDFEPGSDHLGIPFSPKAPQPPSKVDEKRTPLFKVVPQFTPSILDELVSGSLNSSSHIRTDDALNSSNFNYVKENGARFGDSFTPSLDKTETHRTRDEVKIGTLGQSNSSEFHSLLPSPPRHPRPSSKESARAQVSLRYGNSQVMLSTPLKDTPIIERKIPESTHSSDQFYRESSGRNRSGNAANIHDGNDCKAGMNTSASEAALSTQTPPSHVSNAVEPVAKPLPSTDGDSIRERFDSRYHLDRPSSTRIHSARPNSAGHKYDSDAAMKEKCEPTSHGTSGKNVQMLGSSQKVYFTPYSTAAEDFNPATRRKELSSASPSRDPAPKVTPTCGLSIEAPTAHHISPSTSTTSKGQWCYRRSGSRDFLSLPPKLHDQIVQLKQFYDVDPNNNNYTVRFNESDFEVDFISGSLMSAIGEFYFLAFVTDSRLISQAVYVSPTDEARMDRPYSSAQAKAITPPKSAKPAERTNRPFSSPQAAVITTPKAAPLQKPTNQPYSITHVRTITPEESVILRERMVMGRPYSYAETRAITPPKVISPQKQTDRRNSANQPMAITPPKVATPDKRTDRPHSSTPSKAFSPPKPAKSDERMDRTYSSTQKRAISPPKPVVPEEMNRSYSSNPINTRSPPKLTNREERIVSLSKNHSSREGFSADRGHSIGTALLDVMLLEATVEAGVGRRSTYPISPARRESHERADISWFYLKSTVFEPFDAPVSRRIEEGYQNYLVNPAKKLLPTSVDTTVNYADLRIRNSHSLKETGRPILRAHGPSRIRHYIMSTMYPDLPGDANFPRWYVMMQDAGPVAIHELQAEEIEKTYALWLHNENMNASLELWREDPKHHSLVSFRDKKFTGIYNQTRCELFRKPPMVKPKYPYSISKSSLEYLQSRHRYQYEQLAVAWAWQLNERTYVLFNANENRSIEGAYQTPLPSRFYSLITTFGLVYISFSSMTVTDFATTSSIKRIEAPASMLSQYAFSV